MQTFATIFALALTIGIAACDTEPSPGAVTAPADKALIDALMLRAKSIIDSGRAELKTLEGKKSYFAVPLDARLRQLEKFAEEVAKLSSNPSLTVAQLGLYEARLLMMENDLLQLLQLEKDASKDATFAALIQVVDKLLERAYTQLGKLMMHEKQTEATHRFIGAVQVEIRGLRTAEDEIKRLQPGSIDRAKTIETLETLLRHEQTLETLLFVAEHDDILNPPDSPQN